MVMEDKTPRAAEMRTLAMWAQKIFPVVRVLAAETSLGNATITRIVTPPKS